jgi:hypothetical protein
MTIPTSFADDGRVSWREGLSLGLPKNLDFSNIQTANDAFHLILSLPNAQRGIAAKLLYENRGIVGTKVAFRGLMEAWNHDRGWALSAFGSGIAFAAALREVNPARKGNAPIIAWRGTDNVDAVLGLSWTTNRDVACFFAVRSKFPLVFRSEFHPDDIVARYNGRYEQELIVDPLRIDLNRVALDDGRKEVRIYACDIVSHQDVSSAALSSWQAGALRYATFIKARDDRRWQEARARAGK